MRFYQFSMRNYAFTRLICSSDHDVSVAANDDTAYTQILRPHRKLILTAILLKISQINLKMIRIQKIEKLAF